MAAKLRVHPVASLFPAMTDLEFYELKEDIRLHGLKVPILLSKDGRIVDGRHRYKACNELGITPSFTKSKFDDDATLAVDVVSMNLKRRHLTDSQLGMVGARLRSLFEAAAKQRAEEGRKAGAAATKAKAKAKREGSSVPDRHTFKPVTGRKAAADAANKVGVNTRMVEHGVRVLRIATPEVVKAVDAGMVPLTAASRLTKHEPETQKAVITMLEKGEAKNVRDAVRKLTLEAQVAAIKKTPPPVGQFEVLVVDPPWTFNKTREDDDTQRGRTPYPTMTEEQIAAIKLPVATNSILWLWTTNAHLVTGEASRILQAWGFNPKTMLTWVKPKMGVGDWLRGQTEHCIMATKGRPVVTPPIPSTVLNAPVGAHSEKPDEFYALVENLCPGAKGELFARKARQGWNQHGVELETPAAGYVVGVDPAGGPDVTVVVPVPVPDIPPAPAGTLPPIVRQQ